MIFFSLSGKLKTTRSAYPDPPLIPWLCSPSEDKHHSPEYKMSIGNWLWTCETLFFGEMNYAFQSSSLIDTSEFSR